MDSVASLLIVLTVGAALALPVEAFQSQPKGEQPTRLATQHSIEDRINRALQYLWSKQSDDGSWKSEYYGNLKQGAATTSLVLFALSQCPQRYLTDKRQPIEKAFEFQRRGIAKNGYVSNESGPGLRQLRHDVDIVSRRQLSEQAWLENSFSSRTQTAGCVPDELATR